MALDKLKEQKSILQGYVMDEIFIKMQGGNALIAPYYAGDYFIMYGENEDLGFYYPSEGTNFFVDAMCIPKDAKHVEEAMLYIDFMLSKEIAIANAEYICYASPNTQVIEDPGYLEYLQALHPDAIDILYPELENYKTESYLNLSADMRKYEYELWEELMVYGESDVGIYIIAGIFAAVIVAMVTYSLIKKRIYSNY
jgi:spermidine/putrescine-binding protein